MAATMLATCDLVSCTLCIAAFYLPTLPTKGEAALGSGKIIFRFLINRQMIPRLSRALGILVL